MPYPISSRPSAKPTQVAYLLRDEFTDTRAGGSVNGTTPVPAMNGSGNRTVVDAGNKLSLGSGIASFATGAAAIGNPGIWYREIAREAGRMVVFEATISDTVNNTANIGWDTNQSGAITDALRFLASGLLQIYPNGTSLATDAYAAATSYYGALVMRSAGMYFFIKGGSFTKWTLLYASLLGSSSMYPVIEAQGATASAFSSSFIRIPTELWLPSYVAYDTFNRENGAIGSTVTGGPDGQSVTQRTWTGATWTIATNKAVNTPTQGSDVITNGTFDVDESWNKGTGWTIGDGKATKAAGEASNLSQVALTLGRWYLTKYDLVVRAGGFRIIHGSGGDSSPTRTSTNTYYNTGRAITDGTLYVNATSAAGDGDVDNVITKQLTLSSLFASITDVLTSDVFVGADLTIVSGTQAGVVLCLDNESNPANFIIGYHNGTNAVLDKCVAGVYTNLISAAATYSANATLMVRKIGTAFELYYNGARIGTGATVSDAGIISNTKHGLFSTYNGNTSDNFQCIPVGSNGEHAYLDRFIGIG